MLQKCFLKQNMIHDIDFLKRTMNDVPSILNMNKRLLINLKSRHLLIIWL